MEHLQGCLPLEWGDCESPVYMPPEEGGAKAAAAAGTTTPPGSPPTYGSLLSADAERRMFMGAGLPPPPPPLGDPGWGAGGPGGLGAPVPRRPPPVVVVFMRLRRARVRGADCKWFEFLLEYWRNRGEYQFPQGPEGEGADGGGAAAAAVLHRMARRGLVFPPPGPDPVGALAPYLRTSSLEAGGVPHRVYLLPVEVTQAVRPSRVLRAPPDLYWVAESELAVHEQVGVPTCFGRPVSTRTLAAAAALGPLGLRFASVSPPLVLYHGTDAVAALAIAKAGFRVSETGEVGMLGRGVYLARWDKALRFAAETADRRARPEAGLVVRSLLFAPTVRTLGPGDVCRCGACAGKAKPFVDHDGQHRGTAAASFVPDNSLPATRRAEWCVADPGYVVPDCLLEAG